MKAEIYIDIDGVLNRWLLHEMSRRLGWQIKDSDWPLWYGWDIVSVYNHLTPQYKPIAADDFWKFVPESSWVNAPRSELFDLLMERPASIVGRENVHVVTTVPRDRNPAAYSGKAKWCIEHLPEWLQSQVYMVTHDKSRLARPARLLIDDADHNILAWQAEGGATIQVPRPWSANYRLGQQDDTARLVVEDGLRNFQNMLDGC